MRRSRAVGLAFVFLVRLSAAQEAPSPGDGWVRLFDGGTLRGWTSSDDALAWTVADGVVRAEEGPSGLLVSSARFADFELRCEVRVARGANSGIFLRTVAHPKDFTECWELNVCDSHPTFPTGSLVGLVKPGPPIVAGEEWHAYRVLAEGNRVRVEIDGRLAVLGVDEAGTAPRSGSIGLQKNEGRAEFRDVWIRPLGLMPVPGGDLDVEGTARAFGPSLPADFVFSAELRCGAGHRRGAILLRAHDAPGEADAIEIRVAEGEAVPATQAPRRLVVAAAGSRLVAWIDGELVLEGSWDLATLGDRFGLAGRDPGASLRLVGPAVADTGG